MKGALDKPKDKFIQNRNLSNYSSNAKLNSRPALLSKKNDLKVNKKRSSIPTNDSRIDQFDSSRIAREVRLTGSDLNARDEGNHETSFDNDQEFTVSDHMLNDSVYLQKRPNFRGT